MFSPATARTMTRQPCDGRSAWGGIAVRRGVSFLEVVLGVTLLGLVAGTLSMSVGAIAASSQRQRDRLGAAEIASRILLMRNDDEDSLPSQTLTIPYGKREYRWTIDEGPVLITLSEQARAAAEDGAASNTIDLSRRLKAITVTAWLGENSGGAYQYDPNVPHYTLTRLIDPLSFPTHDSAQRQLKDQTGVEGFLQNVIDSMNNSGEAPVNGGRRRSQNSRSNTTQSRQPQPIPPERLNDGGGG